MRRRRLDMPQRRNRLKPQPRRVTHIEALEARRLLTTIVGGGHSQFDGTPIAISYGPFADTAGTLFRINVAGDVQAEAMGFSSNAPVDLVGPVANGVDL